MRKGIMMGTLILFIIMIISIAAFVFFIFGKINPSVQETQRTASFYKMCTELLDHNCNIEEMDEDWKKLFLILCENETGAGTYTDCKEKCGGICKKELLSLFYKLHNKLNGAFCDESEGVCYVSGSALYVILLRNANTLENQEAIVVHQDGNNYYECFVLDDKYPNFWVKYTDGTAEGGTTGFSILVPPSTEETDIGDVGKRVEYVESNGGAYLNYVKDENLQSFSWECKNNNNNCGLASEGEKFKIKITKLEKYSFCLNPFGCVNKIEFELLPCG